MWLFKKYKMILVMTGVMFFGSSAKSTQVVTSFDKASLLQQQIERILQEVEAQRDYVVREIMSSYAPSATSRIMGIPHFLVKHALYLLGSTLIGAGILFVISSDDLAKIRDAFLERDGIWGFITGERMRAVIKDPRFLGKTVLSFVLTYLVLIILFEYVLKTNTSEAQRETLQKLARLLEHYEVKLKELKMALP